MERRTAPRETEPRTTAPPPGNHERTTLEERRAIDERARPVGDYYYPYARSPRDVIRWSAVWAGLLTTVTLMVALTILGVAAGLTAIGPATDIGEVGMASSIYAIVAGIIAFLIGGVVAGGAAGVTSRSAASINGAMVFVLAVPFIVVMSALGAGGVLGAIGAFTAAATPVVEAEAAVAVARDAAWIALAAMVVGLLAAWIGGLVAPRSREPEG